MTQTQEEVTTERMYYFDGMCAFSKWSSSKFSSDAEAIAYGKNKEWCDVIYRGKTEDEKEFEVIWESKDKNPERYAKNSKE